MCCVDNSCEGDAITPVQSEINDARIMGMLASPLFSQETEASADQPEIYHSGREKFGTTLIIVPIKHFVIQYRVSHTGARVNLWRCFHKEESPAMKFNQLKQENVVENPKSQEFLKVQ